MHFLFYRRPLNESFSKWRFLQLFDQHTPNPLCKFICVKENLVKMKWSLILNVGGGAWLCNQIEYLIDLSFTVFWPISCCGVHLKFISFWGEMFIWKSESVPTKNKRWFHLRMRWYPSVGCSTFSLRVKKNIINFNYSYIKHNSCQSSAATCYQKKTL